MEGQYERIIERLKLQGKIHIDYLDDVLKTIEELEKLGFHVVIENEYLTLKN